MITRSFDWSHYFKIAKELASRSDEAAIRSAMSRAYYYIYHLALERAQSNGFAAVPGESSHKQLWRIYSASSEPSCQQLAQIADRLKEKRERADYRSTYARIADDIPDMLADAQDFATRLQQLHQRHPNPASVRQQNY